MKTLLSKVFEAINGVDDEEDKATMLIVVYAITVVVGLFALLATYGFLRKIITMVLGAE